MAVLPGLPLRRPHAAEPTSKPPTTYRHQLLLLSPGAAWLMFFGILPLGLVMIYSFAQRGVYGGVELQWTISNYIHLLDPLYLTILWRSVAIAALTTVFCLVLGYPLAYAIATVHGRWKNRMLLLVIIPFWTNFLIRTYAWIMILRSEGLLNAVLMWAGVINQPLNMLYTTGAVLVGFIYNWLPFMVLPIYASLEKIPRSYIEAAMDLGAHGWTVLRRIIIPLSLPGIAAGSILVFIPALAMFAIPDLLGGARTMLIGNLIKNQFLSARNWPFGAAASVGLIAMMLVALFVYRRSLQVGRE